MRKKRKRLGPPGVYRILNLVNGKVYIGSSIDCATRWHLHKHHLRSGAHRSRHLQAAWAAYGEKSFWFKIVETTAPVNTVILAAEQKWINALRACDREFGYNTDPVAGSPLGRKMPAEAVARAAAARRGIPGKKAVFVGERLSELLKLRATGMSAVALGKIFGTTGATVMNTLNGKQILTRGVTDPLPSVYKSARSLGAAYDMDTARTIKRLLSEGFNNSQISRMIDVCRKTVGRIALGRLYTEVR